MTTLEDFYFGNVNPSEYKQSKSTKKKLSEMTRLLEMNSDLPSRTSSKRRSWSRWRTASYR